MAERPVNIDEIQERLERLPFALDFRREGCTEQDILALEAYAGCHLPFAYVEFLKVFGRHKGRFFKGMSACLSDRYGLHLRELANDVLDRTHSTYRIPESSFVFAELQGYAFWLFPLSAADDPPVFTVGEGESKPTLLRSSFTEFLQMSVQELEELAIRRPAAFQPPSKHRS